MLKCNEELWSHGPSSDTVRSMRLVRGCAAALACLLLSACGSSAGVQPGKAPTFAPRAGAWSLVPPGPLAARHEAAGAFLDGRFYVVGGWSDPPCPPTASCTAPADPAHRDGATFDPATGLWQQIAPAPGPVGGVSEMTPAGDKLYLLTGDVGRADSPVAFLSYDPGSDAWATLPAPPAKDAQLVGAGSKLVAVGGTDEQAKARDFVFDPGTSRWTQLPDDPLGPSFGRGAVWLGDRLLLTASDLVDNPGADGPVLTRLAVLDDSFTRWTQLPDSDIIGGYPVWAADRVVFPMTGSADGGKVGNWGRDYFYGAILDPAGGTWAPLPTPRPGHTGLEGRVGHVGDQVLVGGQLLQPQTRTWTPVPDAPWGEGHRSSQTIVTGPDSVLVWAGDDGTNNLAEGYLLPVR